jgi:phthalate 4,5-cis-dihydrodiol dehydrogenase
MVKSVRAITGQWMAERPCPGYYSALLLFEDGTPATIVHNGYGYFNTAELYWGFQAEDQTAMDRRLQMRQDLRRHEADEEAAKESMRFGGRRDGEMSHFRRPGDGQTRPNIPGDVGVVLASCERGDMRQSQNGGVMIYDDSGRRELDVSGITASRSSELLELYDAVMNGQPVFHGGRWGMATLEVCLAIMESANVDREIRLSHQCPTHD